MSCTATVFVVPHTQAQSTDPEKIIETLKEEISARGDRLKEIEREIESYQTELKKVGSEKNSLQKAINQLELERKKVQADISYTQNKIGATDLEINKLSLEIGATEEDITLNTSAMREILYSFDQIDDSSFIEILLEYETLTDFWRKIDELEQVRKVMREQLASLVTHKNTLQSKHDQSTEKKADLIDLKTQYADQNQILAGNKTEKAKLLADTKNEEAEYQKLLKEKEEARDAILKELRDFESKMQFSVDPNSIPPQGTRVFNWPVQNVIITQLFGGTEFAKTVAAAYGRPYHNGIDLGAPIGTKIYAPLDGVVRATGDTGLAPGCYSWGRWTLIDHANGLTTLYGHQSQLGVVPGQTVKTGEVIGYVGSTGFSTGPHLHFTVYIKNGVTVRKFSEIKPVSKCSSTSIPTAAVTAYLDPMMYLPPVP